MKLSRIDIIGQNGNDGLHYDEGCVKYEELDILDRLKATTKINGAYPKDIEDAINEIEYLRGKVKHDIQRSNILSRLV